MAIGRVLDIAINAEDFASLRINRGIVAIRGQNETWVIRNGHIKNRAVQIVRSVACCKFANFCIGAQGRNSTANNCKRSYTWCQWVHRRDVGVYDDELSF